MMLGIAASSSIAVAERPLQPSRAQFGDEQRDPEAHRNADQQRDQRGDERAVDRRERAEFLGDRVPRRRCRGSRRRRSARPARRRTISARITPPRITSTSRAKNSVSARNAQSPIALAVAAANSRPASTSAVIALDLSGGRRSPSRHPRRGRYHPPWMPAHAGMTSWR